ncbi:WS/DGAT/MGAT family O-acyltransferase [Rhodococcus sp. BE178]|uniref:WS/DGAT/MGAT family O-acyltransferase n=1 Tax=Rhodococcus sp. BE178 TaxID=2817737 RepID=UPI003D1BB073
MELMSPVDLALLVGEIGSRTLHVAALMVFDPAEDQHETFVEAAYRQALTYTSVHPALMRRPVARLSTAGIPTWETVDRLDMSWHLRWSALAPPGGDAELHQLVARLHESQLDRSRPLWSAHLIEGLSGGRFALYVKIHHALLDGMSGIRLIERSLSTDPLERGKPVPLTRDGEEPLTSPARDGWGSLGRSVRRARDLAEGMVAAVEILGKALFGEAGKVAAGLRSEATVLPMQAPRSVLNAKITSARTFSARSWPKARIRSVQDATGASCGDVILAMCAGALRAWLLERGELPDAPLVALVPVAQRRRTDADSGGNSVGVALCNLGTDLADPLDRLDLIVRSMTDAKKRIHEQGLYPSLVTAVPDLVPNLTTILPLDPHLRPTFNLVISNIPGPRQWLYWNGAPLRQLYPVSVVFDGIDLNITVCHYADELQFGCIGAPESVPHIERLIEALEEALCDLETATARDGS